MTSTAAAVATEKKSHPALPQGRKAVGYGLPCAKCKTYYAADLKVCPICKTSDRVSPKLSASPSTVVNEQIPDPAVLEEERERFLREFSAQILASQAPLNPGGSARCTRDENHPGGSETAAICQSCYEQLQERVDALETALHIELKQAAEIVYEAVWADTSDPAKTYENAAQALLTELRKRSGVTPLVGLMPPLPE